MAFVTRYFIKLDDAGNVISELASSTDQEFWTEFDKLSIPDKIVEVTNNPQKGGFGSLLGKEHKLDGTFDTKPVILDVVTDEIAVDPLP